MVATSSGTVTALKNSGISVSHHHVEKKEVYSEKSRGWPVLPRPLCGSM